jgi:cysteine desulfurase
MDRVYFDYNATTPLAPEVALAMRPYMDEAYGNPSSLHWAGQRARTAIELARRQVATLLGCEPSEVIFTSGGTEGNNAALAGVYFSCNKQNPPHLIVSSFEHPSVAKTVDFLERLGAQVTRVSVDRFGELDPADVRRAIRPNTALVSVIHANNEVGTIEPIAEIASIAREHGVLMHSDAAQSAGKIPVNVRELGVDLLTVAGHKMYAPQEPFMHGAAHETGRRAGTENVLEIVALGAACELAGQRTDATAMRNLRDHFWQRLQECFGKTVVLNGHPERRLPNTLNVSFTNRFGHEILSRMDGLAASTGSACHDGSYDLSPVLHAMGVPESIGLGAIRFSLGRNSRWDEVESVVDRLSKVVTT